MVGQSLLDIFQIKNLLTWYSNNKKIELQKPIFLGNI